MLIHLWGTKNEQIEFTNLIEQLAAEKKLKVTVCQEPIEAGYESGDINVRLYGRRLSVELNE